MDSKMAKIEHYGGHSSSRKGNYSHRKGDQRGGRSNDCLVKLYLQDVYF